MGRSSRLPWCLGLSLLTIAGCFGKLRRDERMREGMGEVEGRVQVQDWKGSPIVVVAGRLPDKQGETLVVVRKVTLRQPEGYGFVLEPGTYLIGAVEDANHNEKLDDGERAFLSQQVEVTEGATDVMNLTVREAFDVKAFKKKYSVIQRSALAEGEVLALGDKKFGPELADKGLWEPSTYALEDRPGVYMLQPFEKGKTPVLYIHGMSGYPQEFTSLIEGLDRDKFQPWVFLYPSGFPLTEVAVAVDGLVNSLSAKHELERICVVAHSMGGLVARKFLGEQMKHSKHAVRGLVTLASPLGGMSSAGMGTKVAPGVVPSWYDLDPTGPFVEQLYEERLAKDVEYHLLFAFDDAGASDGVVRLTSQLRVQAQGEAEVVLGFRATHTGILKSKAAAAQVGAALRRCAGDETAPRVAPRPEEPSVVDDPR